MSTKRHVTTALSGVIGLCGACAAAATPRGYLNNVAESADYALVYSLDIADSQNYAVNPVPYATDNHLVIGPFSRVAYYMELQKPGGDLTYVWASMDAFTNDTAALGVPTLLSGAVFQRPVAGLTVASNDPGLTTGTGLSGNLEFWPYNYLYANSGVVPGADNSVCDFDDTMASSGNYSCMQLHNYPAGQTLFAFNNWNGYGGNSDIGIGNCPAPRLNGVDWTFLNNAADYTVKTLQVLVLRDGDTNAPTLVSANASLARNLVTVRFSEPLAPSSVSGACFALDNGAQVISATLAADPRAVTLATTRQPGGTLTLTVTGIRDSAAGNPIMPGSSIAVAPPALPPEVAANIGVPAAGYQLVYTLDIPVTGTFNGTANYYGFDQHMATNTFDRVAYYLELQKADGTLHYLWASMDAFTPYLSKIGVPTAASKAVFQQAVGNLDVLSNVSGITTGTGMAGGNIEFWPTDYDGVNEAGVINASDATWDFGDRRYDAGIYGSMQVHNAAASQTLFALNHWGSDGQTLCVGIGNQPTGFPDWTAADNAGAFVRRKLHVLVRPAAGSTASLPAEVAANVPLAAGYQLVCSITNIPVYGNFSTSTSDYSSDTRATAGAFARVGYYLELKKPGEAATFIWTSMDAFTADAMKLGVPVIGTFFKQKVTGLDVHSNVGGIVNGTDLATGNIEFWPSGYDRANSLQIPNASDTAFDFGDYGGSPEDDGYGCMQVHNYGASQTLFAINHFNQGNEVALGIGNNTHFVWDWPDPDWTVAYNAHTYERRVLHVCVLPGGIDLDFSAPTLTGVTSSTTLKRLVVTFSETLSDSAAAVGNFSIDGGVSVTGATLSSDKRSVLLATTAQAPGQAYVVSVSGVRDRSSNANLIAAGASLSFTTPAEALPPVLSGNVPESSDYSLIYQLAIPNVSDVVPYGARYAIDESLFPQTRPFDRVAYCLELVKDGVPQWVYASMDAFTGDLAKIGVPTAARGAVFQQFVNNMNVFASANAPVVTGTAIATGNIEFWPGSFGPENNLNVPNAISGQVFDFGDSGGGAQAGHGSMQIHNYGAGQTILSVSRMGMNGMEPALGVGNNTVFTYGGGYEDPDWTLHPNASTFTTKNLYVLARWGGSTQGAAPVLLSQPADLEVKTRQSARFYVHATGATAYQWRLNGVAIDGASQAWLEISPTALEDSGTYDAVVYGTGAASTTSQPATLRVIAGGILIKLR